jgi:hypothetical protein
MKKWLVFISFAALTISKSGFAQTTYFQLIDSAESKYHQKDYPKAGNLYAQAFQKNNNFASQTDRYNAACSWSLANQPDLSFKQLNNIIKDKGIIQGWNDPVDFYKMLISDKDFDNLKKDKRWNNIIEKSSEKKQKFESKINGRLATHLDLIRNSDQNLRLQLDTIRKLKGLNSVEEKELWERINKADSTNLSEIEFVINKYGWPSPKQVGYKANQTIFLVIQHANIAAQKEYLPIMRKAVKEKKALPKDLALLEDRVAMRDGKKQIYGSQIGIDKESKTYYLYPVIDVDNIDTRRAEVGLGSIASYLKGFNLNWNIKAYKNSLPMIEKRINRNQK